MPRHRVLEEATHENISKAEVHRSSVAAVLMLDAAAYAAGEQPALWRLRHGFSVLCFKIDNMILRSRRSRSRRTIGFGMNCEKRGVKRSPCEGDPNEKAREERG